MKLMSEAGYARTYLGDDLETWYEVRLELKAQTYPVVEEDWQSSDDNPEAYRRVQEAITRCRNSLRAWFMDHVDFDPMGGIETSYSAELYTREQLAQFKFDPNDFLPKVLYRIVIAEQRYWPPAPVDPVPDTTTPKPRSSDFRGDHRA